MTDTASGRGRRRRGRSALTAALLVFPLLAACGGDSEEPEASGGGGGGAEEPLSITVVNGITSFEFMAADMAEEIGVWEDLNLDVEYIRGSGGGGQVTTTMTAGQADLGLHGGGAAAISMAEGMPAKIVAVTAPSFSGMVCVVHEESDIQSFADLEGKTMGISSAGSLTDLVSRMIAKSNGWELGTDFHQATIGDLSQLTAALQEGVVDIICWSAEPALTLVERGQGRILGDAGEIVGPNIFEAIEATDVAIETKPEAIERYLQGYFTAVQYMKDNPDETIEFLAEYASVSEDVARQVYEMEMPNQSLDGTATDEMLEGLIATAADLSGKPVEVEQVWDDQFVPVELP
jgi:ABC-type nitrate/sulfonate/bicarbonate transport system substrate-binding protein